MTIDDIIPAHRLAHFRAGVSAWLGWLVQVVLRIGIFARSRRIRRMVLRAERCVECFCFLSAVRLIQPQPARLRAPLTARTGFRRKRSSGRLLLKCAGIRARNASLADRIARLIAVLENPERYILRFAKRIARGVRKSRLVTTAPPSEHLVKIALTPARADSS